MSQIVTWLAKYKPKTLVKHKLVGAILGTLCPMCAEASGGVDEDEYPAKKSAAQVGTASLRNYACLQI